MSVETRLDAPVDVQRFARVFVKGPEELPSNADTYYDPDRGYYFKLHLDGVSTEEATPLISKARERFNVELVRRVSMDGFYKERVYVDDPSEVPGDKKVHEGPAGGIYYETGVEQVGVDESPDTRNVAVIYWDDVELGDEIVYQTPEGDEIFAEIIDIEEQPEQADVVIVDINGEPQRASPGTYTVDDTEKAVGGRTMVWKEGDPNWVPYNGPRGGDGWRNPSTGEIVYQENPPGGAEGSDEEGMADDPDFDPSDPPDGGYAPGWEGPPEDETDIWPGQQVEWFLDGAYQYGEVEAVEGDRVQVEPDGSDEPVEVNLDEITAREDRDGTAVDTQPDPWSDVQRFEDDEVAQEFIDTVNEEPGEGFTFKRNLEVDNPFERDVWFVGLTSDNMEPGEMDKEKIIDFYHEYLDVLEDEPALHIGGYAFDNGEKVSIDLSVAVEDREEAKQLGEEMNQESIANLYVAEQEGWDEGGVDTGGDGESPIEGPDEVREALSDIESLAKRLMLGKSKVFDHEKIYEVDGRRLTGTQIAYMTLHGDLDPSEAEIKPVEEKSNSALTSGTEGAHSARYSPEDDEDEEDVEANLPPRAEKGKPDIYELGKQDGQWASFVGPRGGEGWVNLDTGEKRYQKRRPGTDETDEEAFPEGWTTPPEDPSELEVGQAVELHDMAGDEYHEAVIEGFEDGQPKVNADSLPGAGVVAGAKQTALTAVEEDFDRHSNWFGQPGQDFTEETYWASIEDEIPDDAPEEFQPFEVGQELALNVPGQEEPVSIPLYGYVDGEGVFPASKESLLFHYDDIEEAVGTDEMYSKWGKPGEASPTISVPVNSTDDAILGPADEVATQSDAESSEDEEGESWDESQLGEEEWLEEQDIQPGTAFNYEGQDVEVAGATSMTGEGELSHVVVETGDGETVPLHPNAIPETIPEGELEGAVETANDPGFDSDNWKSVDDVDIEDVPEGTDVVIGDSKGYYTTAEVYPANVGYDPGDGDTIYPQDVTIHAVHEDDVNTHSESEPEEDGEAPDEEETSSAVAQPASEDSETTQGSGLWESADLDSYTPNDVETTKGMDAINSTTGNTIQSKNVVEMSDGMEAVYTDTDHPDGDPGLGMRAVASSQFMRALSDDYDFHGVPEVDGEPYDGYFFSAVAPGHDVVEAPSEYVEEVDEEDFYRQAAMQVILGNNDAHVNNVKVDEDGNLHWFDLDHAGGSIHNPDALQKSFKYEDGWDRIFGELARTGQGLNMGPEQEIRSKIFETALDVADEFDEEQIEEAVGRTSNYDPELVNNMAQNIRDLKNGDYPYEP